ncbi:MAG: hypothetical protein ACRDX8_02950 [Acidimicrobiales bacterium]
MNPPPGTKAAAAQKLGDQVFSLSIRLVDAEVDPEQAVAQIRELCQGDSDVLRFAQYRNEGLDEYLEDGVARLLSASLGNSPARPPSSSDLVFFSKQRQLDALPIEEAYDELARLEPRLAPLVAKFSEGGTLRSEPHHGNNPLLKWYWRFAHLGADALGGPGVGGMSMHAFLNLLPSLSGIVGPTATSRDLMIRSRMARRIAIARLTVAAGFEYPE